MEWLNIDEYAKLTGLENSAIEDLIDGNKLDTKLVDGVLYIDPSKGTHEVVPAQLKNLSVADSSMVVEPKFVEKTIGTIINLHEKVIDAKDETIESIKSENQFLKEALSSLQELYDEDRQTISALQEQLKLSQQEVEFMRRKYKLMWNKAIEEHTEKK